MKKYIEEEITIHYYGDVSQIKVSCQVLNIIAILWKLNFSLFHLKVLYLLLLYTYLIDEKLFLCHSYLITYN